jgi:hypothetical protein
MNERRTVAERVVTAAVAGVVALGAAAVTQHIWQDMIQAGGTAQTISADPTSPPVQPENIWQDL